MQHLQWNIFYTFSHIDYSTPKKKPKLAFFEDVYISHDKTSIVISDAAKTTASAASSAAQAVSSVVTTPTSEESEEELEESPSE